MVTLWAGSSIPSAAQTAQAISLQLSGIGSYPFGGAFAVVASGYGWEAQVRWNPSYFSLGVGGARTRHEVIGAEGRDLVVAGGFLEPRYVLYQGWESAAPYVSARLALSQISTHFGSFQRTGTGFTVNGGGGLLISLSPRVNLDLGATIGFKDLGRVRLPIGVTNLGTGGNVVGRLGIAAGVW